MPCRHLAEVEASRGARRGHDQTRIVPGPLLGPHPGVALHLVVQAPGHEHPGGPSPRRIHDASRELRRLRDHDLEGPSFAAAPRGWLEHLPVTPGSAHLQAQRTFGQPLDPEHAVRLGADLGADLVLQPGSDALSVGAQLDPRVRDRRATDRGDHSAHESRPQGELEVDLRRPQRIQGDSTLQDEGEVGADDSDGANAGGQPFEPVSADRVDRGGCDRFRSAVRVRAHSWTWSPRAGSCPWSSRVRTRCRQDRARRGSVRRLPRSLRAIGLARARGARRESRPGPSRIGRRARDPAHR